MRQARFPPNWDEVRVQRVLGHYEEQTEEEATAEDKAALGITTRPTFARSYRYARDHHTGRR